MQNFSRLIFKLGTEWREWEKCVFFNGKLTISRKRWEMRSRLLLITNRKWRTLFQMKWKSSTLDDFEGHWQPVRSAILAKTGLLVNYVSPRAFVRFSRIDCLVGCFFVPLCMPVVTERRSSYYSVNVYKQRLPIC